MTIPAFAERYLRKLARVIRRPKHNSTPSALLNGARWSQFALIAVLCLSAFIYLGAHTGIVTEVWPVHGTAGRAASLLRIDILAATAWAATLMFFRKLKYRGDFTLLVLPFALFLIARPSTFHAFSDPTYVPDAGRSKAEAFDYKVQRARYAAVELGYDRDRKAVMGFDSLTELAAVSPTPFSRRIGAFASVLAPLALLLGFYLGKQRRLVRLVRDHRNVLLLASVVAIACLSMFFVQDGRVGNTTPWEFFIVAFIVLWAAQIADDTHNFSGLAVMRPSVAGRLLLHGALPVALFVLLPRTRDFGVAVVLAVTLAVMLVVGTRQRWWIALMGVAWLALVVIAFRYDERSSTRLQLAYQTYSVPTGADSINIGRWASKVHQIKLFDANILAGGFLGRGPGRGHGETAPNAADDGFMTLFAADWGVLGAFSLMVTYTWLLIAMMNSAAQDPGAFKRSLAAGIALLIAAPFWWSSLAAVHVLPLSGVATAFIAHGGSKLLSASFAIGLIAAISHEAALQSRRPSADNPPIRQR